MLNQEIQMENWGSSYFEKTLPLLKDACCTMTEAIDRLDRAKECFLEHKAKLGCANYDCAVEKFDDHLKIFEQAFNEFERELQLLPETDYERK